MGDERVLSGGQGGGGMNGPTTHRRSLACPACSVTLHSTARFQFGAVPVALTAYNSNPATTLCRISFCFGGIITQQT